nr:efflux pump aflt [Quercus suber]
MCDRADLWPTLCVLLDEIGLHGNMPGILDRIGGIRNSIFVPNVHSRPCPKRSRIRWVLDPSLICKYSIVASTTSLKNRPMYQAVCGGAESIALAFGPVISGTIAHHSSWRVSFYVLIPIGIAMLTAVYFFVKDFELPKAAHLSNVDKTRRLDLKGFALYVPMTVCFALGLQWAGIEYAWADWRIVLLLTFAVVLLLCFLTTEYRSGDASMFPLNMLRQRSVALSCCFSFCNSAALFILEFFAVRGATTGTSGLLTLSTAVPLGIAILAAGPITSFIGYYTPVMISGSILMSIAVGLLTTFNLETSSVRVILYQVLYGIGVGSVFQQPYTAVQAILPEAKVPIALVTLAFAQESGGIIALSIAQNIFVDQLTHRLTHLVPGLDPRTILHSGTIGLIEKVPSAMREEVLNAYCDVIVNVFYIALGFTCLTMIGAIGIEWRSIKEEQEQKDEELKIKQSEKWRMFEDELTRGVPLIDESKDEATAKESSPVNANEQACPRRCDSYTNFSRAKLPEP